MTIFWGYCSKYRILSRKEPSKCNFIKRLEDNFFFHDYWHLKYYLVQSNKKMTHFSVNLNFKRKQRLILGESNQIKKNVSNRKVTE